MKHQNIRSCSKYSTHDVVCGVIDYSAWSCNMGKISVWYKILIEKPKKEKSGHRMKLAWVFIRKLV